MTKIKYKIYIDKDFGTIATRDKETGKLTGRKAVKGTGDKTAVRRVSNPVKYSGQIMGRTSPIPVRGNSKSRGYSRSVL